ncbi:MAG: EVE domain-containing protein, partial [Vulcanisaeta sp.]
RGVYGLPKKSSKVRNLIKHGDRLVVYIMKRDCKELCGSFVAVLEAVGEWRRSNSPLWPDEVREGKILYPWIINVKVIVNGTVKFAEVKDELSKLLGREIKDPGKLRPYSVYYSGKPLPSGVGELIEGKLRGAETTKVVTEGSFNHDELVSVVRDIGEWLGFKVKTEYQIDNFRVDAAFFKEPKVVPFAVVEVHVGGDVFKDLASLKHAYDRYGSLLIYVVARDEDSVTKLVNETVRGAFHEIKDKLIIIKAYELRKLHGALNDEAVRKLINALITK